MTERARSLYPIVDFSLSLSLSSFSRVSLDYRSGKIENPESCHRRMLDRRGEECFYDSLADVYALLIYVSRRVFMSGQFQRRYCAILRS